MEAARNPINRLAPQAALLTQEAQVHRQAARPARKAVRPTIRAAQPTARKQVNRPVLQAVHKQAAQPAAHNPVSRPVLKAVRLTPEAAQMEAAHPALQAQAAHKQAVQKPFPKTRYHQVQIRALTAGPQWRKLHKNTSAHRTVLAELRHPDLTAAASYSMYTIRPANPLAASLQQGTMVALTK